MLFPNIGYVEIQHTILHQPSHLTGKTISLGPTSSLSPFHHHDVLAQTFRLFVAASISILVLAFFPVQGVMAQHVAEIPASKDNTLFEDQAGSLSNGVGIYLFSGMTARNETRRALIAFDVANALPPGAAVDSVQVQLFMDKSLAGPVPVSLHPMTTDWGEGTSDAPANEGAGTVATDGDATWIHGFSPLTMWTTPGGDFTDDASATILVGQADTYVWYSTGGLVADVNAWLSDAPVNFGWMILGDESQPFTAKRFASRHAASAAEQPLLRIFYTSNSTDTEKGVLPAAFRFDSAWPNPFTTSTTVGFVADRPGQFELDVIDMTGRIVFSSTVQAANPGHQQTIVPGASLAGGLFVVRISGESGAVIGKLVHLR